MSKLYEPCVDEFDNVHYVKKILSQGGQGIVFRTSDPDTAIKLVTDDNGNIVTSRNVVDTYLEKFRRIRLLPVPKDANITFPAALLSGKAGYVMTFLEGMRPAGSLRINSFSASKINDNEIPQWLVEMPDKNAAKQIVAYYKSGGLRSRLLVLFKISSQLALLHGAGLVYGDISHNNIFFSDKDDRYNIWLIDADNLKYEGEKGTVYTPRYGAPELVLNKSFGTMACDCYSFAVLAYEMLTMVHPFFGKKVYGKENDWADTNNNDGDPEAQALMGNYPWVGDTQDDSNCSDKGLPPVLLYDNEIAELFQRTFGGGRKEPSKRPVIFHWPYAFARAADSTIQCPGCKMSYRYDYKVAENGLERCPYCDKPKPAMIVMEAYSWENNALGKKQWTFVREIDLSVNMTFPSRLFSVFSVTKSDIPVLEIYIRNDSSVLFKRREDADMEFSIATRENDDGRFMKLSSQIRFKSFSGGKNISEFHIYVSYNNLSRMVICTIKDAVK